MEKQKKILISHPTGNANVRGVLDGFYKAGILQSFHTCIACFKGTWFYKLAVGPLKEFRRREFSSFLRRYTHIYPGRELLRLLALKLHRHDWIKHETGYCCIDKVYQGLDRNVAQYMRKNRNNFDAIYTYEDCALLSFREAKKREILCLYDLPTGYWRSRRKLLDEEYLKNPEWATIIDGFNDSNAKLLRKDKELSLADRIYVASTFTKETLKSYPGILADIEVIPYGFPPVCQYRKYVPFAGRKIKALYVGGLNQGKGLSYLFQSLNGLENRIELTVVGRGNIEQCQVLKTALSKVIYIPSLPHAEILKLMSNHDVFIFPSLFEGFGLVITEAMSQGTPVITTERTCGPDLITHGTDGWIVKAGSVESLRETLVKILDNPMVLQEAGRKAMETASKYPWSCYESKLSESIKHLLNEKHASK